MDIFHFFFDFWFVSLFPFVLCFIRNSLKVIIVDFLLSMLPVLTETDFCGANGMGGNQCGESKCARIMLPAWQARKEWGKLIKETWKRYQICFTRMSGWRNKSLSFLCTLDDAANNTHTWAVMTEKRASFDFVHTRRLLSFVPRDLNRTKSKKARKKHAKEMATENRRGRAEAPKVDRWAAYARKGGIM